MASNGEEGAPMVDLAVDNFLASSLHVCSSFISHIHTITLSDKLEHDQNPSIGRTIADYYPFARTPGKWRRTAKEGARGKPTINTVRSPLFRKPSPLQSVSRIRPSRLRMNLGVSISSLNPAARENLPSDNQIFMEVDEMRRRSDRGHV